MVAFSCVPVGVPVWEADPRNLIKTMECKWGSLG